MYARYRTRSHFYKRPERALKAYGVTPNTLRRPKIKHGLLNGIYADEKVDLRDRERLELLESIRHPRERDFYQDHTYHNQWIARDLETHQRAQLATRYPYFAPNYEIKPWLWYPGDVVEVVSGEGVGQRGTIIAVVKYKNEILVQNINIQDVVVPASETRPEQIVQREHPISVLRVRHIDPSSNNVCSLEMIKVRNKETGELEERRISLETGTLLPIPAPEDAIEAGDPLKDTPIQDADETTYNRQDEMPLLVERRLQAMENYFVGTLKQSYEYHSELQLQNARDLLSFQKGVMASATEKLAEAVADPTSLAPGGTPRQEDRDDKVTLQTAKPSWWSGMLETYIAVVEEEAAAALREAEEEAVRQQERDASDRVEDSMMMGGAGEDMDDDAVVEDDDDLEAIPDTRR